jgi:hypothetical protein
MGFAIAALVVAVVSGGFSGWSVLYSRKSANASVNAASSAAITAGLDADRRHSELTPRFRITVSPTNPGSDTLKLVIYLNGPAELGRLDELNVTIRNDHHWRGETTQLAGGPTQEQIAEHIWGRWRFIPSVGPGADSIRGIPGADDTGRTCPTRGMPVGEELQFALEPTQPPRWSEQTTEQWHAWMGNYLRLRLECRRDGHEPWLLTVEMTIDDQGVGFTEVPESLD